MDRPQGTQEAVLLLAKDPAEITILIVMRVLSHLTDHALVRLVDHALVHLIEHALVRLVEHALVRLIEHAPVRLANHVRFTDHALVRLADHVPVRFTDHTLVHLTDHAPDIAGRQVVAIIPEVLPLLDIAGDIRDQDHVPHLMNLFRFTFLQARLIRSQLFLQLFLQLWTPVELGHLPSSNIHQRRFMNLVLLLVYLQVSCNDLRLGLYS